MNDGRALYLEAGRHWTVTLSDGVALSVQTPGRARSLVPLRRLARVQSSTDAQWSTDALLACLRAGVPVVYRDARGAIVGWCFGPRQRELTLAQRLHEAVREPLWPQFWQAWQHQAARQELLLLQQQLVNQGVQGLPARDLDGMRVRTGNLLRQRLGRGAAPWLRALDTAVHTLAAQVCAELVDDPLVLAWPAPGVNLCAALARLLQCRADQELLRLPAAAFAAQPPAQLAAGVIEARGAVLYRAGAERLGDLERALREWQR